MKLKIRSKSIWVVLAFACAIVISSCRNGNSNLAIQTQTVTLARTMSPLNVLLDVADKQNMWSQEGIVVHEETFPSARQAMDAIVTNSSDLAAVADTPLLIAEHREPNLKLLCTLSASDHHLALVLNSKRIEPTCDGLKGKRIALSVGTTQEYFFDHYLHRAASECGITVVNLTPVDALTAFVRSNELDGIVAWEPQLSLALKRPGSLFVSGDPFPQVFALAYGPRSKLTDAALRERVRKVLANASQWTEQHPADTASLLASTQQISSSDAEALRQRYNFTIDREDAMISEMAQQEQWAKDKGYIDTIFGIDEIRRIVGR